MYNTATFCAFCQLHVVCRILLCRYLGSQDVDTYKLQITTDMMMLLFDHEYTENIYPKIEAMSNRLTAWYSELPSSLKIEEGLSQCSPPHIASLK